METKFILSLVLRVVYIQNVMHMCFTVLTRSDDKQYSLRITGKALHWENEVP